MISTIGMFKVDSYQAFCRGLYNLIWDWERELKETKLKHLSKLSGGVVITYKLKVGDGLVEQHSNWEQLGQKDLEQLGCPLGNGKLFSVAGSLHTRRSL